MVILWLFVKLTKTIYFYYFIDLQYTFTSPSHLPGTEMMKIMVHMQIMLFAFYFNKMELHFLVCYPATSRLV